MAGGGLAGAAQFSGSGAERDAARPLDDLPHPTPDRRGNPSGGVPLGAAAVGGKGPAEGEDGGHRCHDLGGERGLALDCAPGDGRGLSGVSQAAGAGIGDCYAHTGAVGEARSEEHTSELQSQSNLVCRLLLEKKKKHIRTDPLSKPLIHSESHTSNTDVNLNTQYIYR